MDTNPPSTGLEALQSAYRAAPESKIFAPLGDAYRRAGRLTEAVAVLDQGTARHPDYVAALVLLALCQLDLGRDAEAEASLARVLALDPENLVALKSRARRALRRQDGSQAEPLLELVLGIDPYDREALQLRDELRAQRAAVPAVAEPSTPARLEVPPWSDAPTPMAPPAALHLEPVASPPPAPEHDASPPPPVPATSDAEWDVQRDADRIVIRPRSLAEPRLTPADEFSTLTLARIYESQGLVDKAVAIYEQLQRQQPENAEIASRLQALRARLLAAAEAAPAAPAPVPAGPTWRLLDAETLAATPEEAAEQLRELTDSVRDRERSRRHTEIGQATPVPAPAAAVPQEEPDFERFLRYVRSLKHTR